MRGKRRKERNWEKEEKGYKKGKDGDNGRKEEYNFE